ncbi:hypothetical protein B0H63DRAFT_453317 [Podospora didyma]|uniref:Uncharacterized protein n=1 Tax=Podospora didyma TaxID=330526 RepID=A0AAE0N6C7_9PEZI|nr:hypothetical protein B0H63DRAFT_453317 [Podospora didyma]
MDIDVEGWPGFHIEQVREVGEVAANAFWPDVVRDPAAGKGKARRSTGSQLKLGRREFGRLSRRPHASRRVRVATASHVVNKRSTRENHPSLPWKAAKAKIMGLQGLRKDLPVSMVIAGFIGVSWYIDAEISTS